MTNRYNYKPLLFLYISIPYHNVTSINNVNVHLTVITSLRVPPLLAYDLSNLDIILLLFVNWVFGCLLPA